MAPPTTNNNINNNNNRNYQLIGCVIYWVGVNHQVLSELLKRILKQTYIN